MSRRLRSSHRHLGSIASWCCTPFFLFACAQATEATGIDGDAVSGAPSAAAGASASASAGAAAGGTLGGSGAANTAGIATSGSAAGSSGSANEAGKSGNGAGEGGASSAGRGGMPTMAGGGASAGTAGTAGTHDCKVLVDLDGYTPTKPGCGSYTSCKGQIHWRNNEAQALTHITLSFSVATGVQCIADNAPSKWTITDNGASSHHCVFTAIANALSVDASSSFGFGFDTTQTDAAMPKDIAVADPSCG
jgi:hypothetical protein